MKTNEWFISYDCGVSKSVTMAGHIMFHIDKAKHMLSRDDISKIQQIIKDNCEVPVGAKVRIISIVPLESQKELNEDRKESN